MSDDDHLASCMLHICDPELSKNPLAWFDLDRAGMTREILKEFSNAGRWAGAKPYFANAPDRKGDIWLKLVRSRGTPPEDT